MAEVRTIAKSMALPCDEDYVLIERIVGRSFVANGCVRRGLTVHYFTPPPFENRKAAIDASLVWATTNGVTIVYVRRGEP